jgi:hypothetical protein
MLFKQAFLDGIQAGTITLAFRRWQRPTVKAGGTLLTAVGQLSIVDVTPVTLSEITATDARRAGWDSLEALRKELRREGRGGRAGSGSGGEQIYRIKLGALRADPRVALRAEGLDDKAADDLRARLDRLDARAADGPWTRRTLELIREHPGLRAGDKPNHGADYSGPSTHQELSVSRSVREMDAGESRLAARDLAEGAQEG